MKWVSNLPDSTHTPFPVIAREPHIKVAVQFFRPSDYAVWGAITAGGPGALYLWERFQPTVSRKTLPKALAIQLPSFALFGFLLATQNTYFRLWGWKENAREATKWAAEGRSERVPASWSDSDW